jgi:hypothetical protein
MTETSIIESVVIGGDLSKLTPDQRVSYYKAVCTSLNLNPLTKPFSYITLNGKLTLYANKDAADQLRNLKNISIDKPEITFQDDWIIVTVVGYDSTGRKDSDVGVINKKDMRGDFGNALMKAVTKAKRRLTLSICGLGMLDETEISSIPDARPVVMNLDTGEILPVSANVETPVKTETVIVDKPHDKLRDKIYAPDTVITDTDGTMKVTIPANLLSTDDVDTATNSKGELLIDLQTDKLSYMANSLMKSLKDNGLSPLEKAAKQAELKAITTIIADRNKATE